jgi:hypothetical protein
VFELQVELEHFSRSGMDVFPAVGPVSGSSTKEPAQNALQANITHQHVLTKYARQLEAELQELDGLIVSLIFMRAPSLVLTKLCNRVPWISLTLETENRSTKFKHLERRNQQAYAPPQNF